LVHHPVDDRQGRVVTAAITNIDLHDISRSALTYGLCGLWVAHPVTAQRTLAERIREHWVEGSGGRRIPDRVPALSQLHVVESLDEAMAALGPDTELWTTSARPPTERALGLKEARQRLRGSGPPVLIAFGTGWGLSEPVHERAAARLCPIVSPTKEGYNHLSVRAAAAIMFDRLLGVP
jgi:hypothetical protein